MNAISPFAGAMQPASAARSSAPAAKPADATIALQVERVAPFSFIYTKVRVATGETIWRWPGLASGPVGGLINLVA
jgi:hypothetical protein